MIDSRPQECEKKLVGSPQEENGFTEGTEMGSANFFDVTAGGDGCREGQGWMSRGGTSVDAFGC
jgi:hypothetical protein